MKLKEVNQAKDATGVTRLSINELRARLYDEGKDYDGSRKRLIEQLESPEKKPKTS